MTDPDPATRAAAYVRRIKLLVADREPTAILANLSPELRRILDGVPREALETPEAPGRWSADRVVHHLADTEVVYGYRLRMALTLDGPRFERFDQDLWATRFAGPGRSVAGSLAQVNALRTEHLDLFRTLAPGDRARWGVHDSRGKETVGEMLVLWAGHDLIHLEQLRRIVASTG